MTLPSFLLKIYRNSLFVIVFVFSSLVLVSCGGGNKVDESQVKTDDEAFYSTQPFHSGLYEAGSFEITGKNERKGKFDGRIYFSLSPDRSVIYVFENGNHTKIAYPVEMHVPFEKTDSGTYVSKDTKDRLVTVQPDSIYILNFQHSGNDVRIGFTPKARKTGSAYEIIEQINQQIEKDKEKNKK